VFFSLLCGSSFAPFLSSCVCTSPRMPYAVFPLPFLSVDLLWILLFLGENFALFLHLDQGPSFLSTIAFGPVLLLGCLCGWTFQLSFCLDFSFFFLLCVGWCGSPLLKFVPLFFSSRDCVFFSFFGLPYCILAHGLAIPFPPLVGACFLGRRPLDIFAFS